jgi:hypothetical protein
LLALLAAPPLAAPGRTFAQSAEVVTQVGAITGTVLAASTGDPISGAVVVLEAARDAALVQTGQPFLGRSLTVVTGERGTYRFDGVPPGSYRLLVRRVGYHPAMVEVELARATAFRVSVGLVINPIRLEAVDITAPTGDPFGRRRALAEETRVGRLEAERLRQERFLQGDATVLTHADVVEAVTLGETDLFRALQRLPGVTSRDDWTAGMWTRGAPWGQTRVYLDGLPLFNPLHALGVLSGVSPDAVGTATFNPGGRSAALGEGAAGVVSLTTRGAGAPGARGFAELSVLSARAAGEWASAGGRTGVMVAARRSHVDVATRLAEALGADRGTYVPYAFYDLASRADLDLGGGWGLEASGLWSQDGMRRGVPDLLRDTRGRWGNLLGRVSLVAPPRRHRARLTVGVSRFDGRLAPTPPSVTTDDAPTHAPTRNTVTVAMAGLEISPTDGGARPPWALGVEATFQRLTFIGQYPRPYPVVVLPESLVLRQGFDALALWVERRWALGPHAAVETGLRAEQRDRANNAAPVTVAPRLAARVTPGGGRVTLSAALARSWQYTQALAPAGPSVGPDLYLTDVWLLAGDTIPAVRADIATLGAEVWLGGGWIGAVHGYARRSTGVAVPEPAPGPLDARRPVFVEAINRALGVEVSLRRIVGRWTTSLSYARAGSELDAPSGTIGGTFRYPTPADRRHAVDATIMARLDRGVRLGAAVTAVSGAPFSRFVLGIACRVGQPGCSSADTAALYIESPNAERAPAYAAVDLLADWSGRWWGLEVGAFLQLRNLLGRDNAVTYTGSLEQCAAAQPPELVRAGPGVCDRFERGIGLLPLVGVRAAF